MEFLLQLLFAVLVTGFFLWLALLIADRGNRKNKILAAFGWSLVTIGAFYWPFVGFIVGLIVLMFVLMRYYDTGFFKAIAVIILMTFFQFALEFVMNGFTFET